MLATRCKTTCDAMMKKSTKMRKMVRMRPLTEKALRSSKEFLNGVAGSWICDGRYDRNDGTSVVNR